MGALNLDHGRAGKCDLQSRNGHPRLIDLDAVLAHFQLDRLTGLRCALADLDFGCLVPLLDGERIVFHFDNDLAIALLDCKFVIPLLDGGRPFVLDFDGLVMPDFQVVVVLNHAVEVLFGMEVDVLGALLVLEAQLVEVLGGAALGAARLERRSGVWYFGNS